MGCVAVSEFVSSYVCTWDKEIRSSSDGVFRLDVKGDAIDVPPNRVFHVQLAAFGVFGKPEAIQDYGSEVIAYMLRWVYLGLHIVFELVIARILWWRR